MLKLFSDLTKAERDNLMKLARKKGIKGNSLFLSKRPVSEIKKVIRNKSLLKK